MKRYWLMKSEPDVYSIQDLARDKVTSWSGVRNYQARNYMRDDMKIGDLVLFYHSSTETPGVAGIASVVRLAHPDLSALDPKSPYHDPRATPENPIWLMVDVGYVSTLKQVISLDMLRDEPSLSDMLVLKRGMRLSIQPVDHAHFKRIETMASR